MTRLLRRLLVTQVRAAATDTLPTARHAAVVVALPGGVRAVCTCGWISRSHATSWDAEREGCGVLAAERQRAARAALLGPAVVQALAAGATEGRPPADVPAQEARA